MREKIGGYIYGRNDAQFLRHSLRSLLNQKLDRTVYVDDGSTDDSVAIAHSLGVTVVERSYHKSWLGTPKLSLVANTGLEYMKGMHYFLVSGSDIVLPEKYVETLVELMHTDPQIVFASGMIEGEHYNVNLPKGAGRVHRASYWWRHIREHPFCWIWESYPVYKAQSQGFKTVLLPTLKMKSLRSSAWRKKNQAYAMKQLGVFPIYALMRCFRQSGVDGVVSYLRCPESVFDVELAKWERRRNIKKLITLVLRHR